MLLLQVAYTYVPFMNLLFDSAPIDGYSWGVLLLLGLLLSAVVAVEKRMQKPKAEKKDLQLT